MSGLVRRGRVYAGTFSSKSSYGRDEFGEVRLVSGRVRRGFLSVGLCSEMYG